jgi:hyaluronan synthase
MALAPGTPSSPQTRIHSWVSAHFESLTPITVLRALSNPESNALDEMYTLLASSPDLGGVTADVKIWNRNESFLALMCDIRYWFAFNVERACQSFWGCVTCISGPMGLYRAYDLDRILGPWSLQFFAGKETTFGDDRHLTNRLLSLGLKTRYTHRTFCQSESPTHFVRWVKQQTRWSKSFFREAFWFPTAFARHSFWLTVETTKQALYPFILIATVLHFLYYPTSILRPISWLATMFGVAFIKSLFAVVVEGTPRMLLFSFYGLFYFFGLLPSVRFYTINCGWPI